MTGTAPGGDRRPDREADPARQVAGAGTSTEPLEVTIDVSAIPRHAAGAGHYLLSLVTALAGRGDVDPLLLARRDDRTRWQRAVLAGDGDPSSVLGAAPRSRPARLAWEQVGLPRLLRREGPAAHHAPHYTMPERAPVGCAVTIHDCTFFDHPEWHQRSKVLVFRRAIAVAARRAGALVCVSRVTAERLNAVCEVAAPVVVAPHGVDRARFAPAEQEPGADAAALAALGVDAASPYIVFVGTLEPRKGVVHLVRAFSRLAATRPELRLVLAGQAGWGMGELEAALSSLAMPERVLRPGYVPDGAVPALLRRAAAAAYPSEAEGYGLPALEALSCGAPLVTTEGTAMAELSEGAAVLVASGDAGALAEALAEVLDEPPAQRERRRQAGMATAARHTWAASAERHLEAYRLAAGWPPEAVG